MAGLLLISDDLGRTARFVRDLGISQSICILDLYDDGPASEQPDLIVSDVKALSSEAFRRLRRTLQRLRGTNVPYLCLLHDNSVRTITHANLLDASALLNASSATCHLINTMSEIPTSMVGTSKFAKRQAETALQFISTVFQPSRSITPDLADVGTAIVADAVRENGIRTWVRIVQRFDDATHKHILLVAGLASAFAAALGLSTTDRHHLAKASLLHDVGKIHVPVSILNKPGKLDQAEMALMRTHAERGHAMLVGHGFDDNILSVVRSHHEMIDGSGYPDKLVGTDIPDFVRLVTICDIYGALIEHRPYRAPMSGKQSYDIMKSMCGRLDADLVNAFAPIAEVFSENDQQR
ncbi:HD domain-containing phosphohydrolase [Methylobacterium sp. Leaf100]|uniref:HD-GYP domain-containing protein n=1 Tax=Methylobacterium sp. Leaf100 TaxID=1736252 RepID=UPI0009E9427E|nr:HD domain-containing phosphohydrolase [Methylobacterium sp. Leaf100]